MENMEIRRVDPVFWKGKRVFLTGHTGFKGSWLSIWLNQMGAEVKGYALRPNTNPALFDLANIQERISNEFGNIQNYDQLKKSMMDFDPQILIHMAAQPLVRLSYKEPINTYMTNVMGTVNVLEASRSCKNLKSIVSVTTDKCYENKEWVWAYRENEPMGGHDPYSSSKGCAELVTAAYRKSFFFDKHSPALASARAGNVIGGGDWATDRLLPDVLKAFNDGQIVTVRSPYAIRPWQHVLEPLSGYLILAENLFNNGNKYAEAWNFGPKEDDCKDVQWILNQMVNIWGEGVSWELDKNPQPHEATFLKLDFSKAKTLLNWEPKWSIKTVLEKIFDWNKVYLANGDIFKKCIEEINEYNS